jgi:hypothetical protein
LVAVLGIIWAAFLIPSRRRSPRSSVEEFERKMTILADANNWSSAGRWVLMPQRGQRFMGSRDRSRARVRRRRRQVFTVLVEATGVTFLIGLVPRLRPMLYGTAILVGLLVIYTLMLLKIRADEVQLARTKRRAPGYASANGNGHSDAAHVRGFLMNDASTGVVWGDVLAPGDLQSFDEDVHVIVRTSEEMEREAILAQASNSR